MQYYRDGYRPGAPDVHPIRTGTPGAVSSAVSSAVSGAAPGTLPEQVDVLIVGTGPAGTVLGAQLAAFDTITTAIIERREGPLQIGQADGVACRTVEMFHAFGLSEALLREAYVVNEVRFWGPDAADRSRVVRTGWVQDTPAGLSEFPHVIVNQARMQQFLLEHMARSRTRLAPTYGTTFVSLSRDDEAEYPLTVQVSTAAGEERTVRAKYVVGCDGARSAVRQAIGLQLEGDAANHAWGVMDVLATTDFPDWRTKNIVQSDGKGSLLMIPREGGNMVRCYVDLGEVQPGESAAIRATTPEQLIEVTNSILNPYSIDVKSVVWSSVYEVGQRLCSRFDDAGAGCADPRVFIAGDACHTHSAKAGQGMNVSMQDAFNLGWKLASVLTGTAKEEVLATYSMERQAIAQDLIDFDRFWSDFIAQPTADPECPELGGITAEEMHAEFARQGRYTAGLATTYSPALLVDSAEHQNLATGFEVGARFHSAPVIRVADGLPTQLGHAATTDGRWRMYAFAGADSSAMLDLVTWLQDDATSPLVRHTPSDADPDAVFDVHGIVRGSHHDVDVTALPALLLPRTGPLGLQDWEKAWAADPAADIFAARGIADEGALVVVRPDQYIAQVLPLSARTELTEFFGGFLTEV